MNRALLKQDAKDAMRMANPHPVLTTLIFMVVGFASTMVLSFISGILGIGDALFDNGAFSLITGVIYLALTIVLSLFLGTVQFGYTVYSLKVFKQEETGINELFGHFPMMLKIFGLSLWMGLFISLWSCLFVIPGIIAALRYSQAFYILAENPDMGIRDCVNESKEMMSGRLWEFFVLQLSFILWELLVSVTCGIAALYVAPYQQITMAGYYLSLKPYDSYDNGYQDGYADGYNAGSGYSDGQF